MQRVITIDSPLFLPPDSIGDLPDWADVFGRCAPLAFEIGCGTGHFAVDMALANPEVNFIALDYYNKGCLKSSRRAERHGAQNIRVVREEARTFLSRCIHPASLRFVYINCPDPWPKKRHRKRRLVNSDFMVFLEPYLEPGADFYFASDFDDYAIDVADMMKTLPGFENMLGPEGWAHDLPGYPQTKYMKRFIAEGKKIFFLHFRCREKEAEEVAV